MLREGSAVVEVGPRHEAVRGRSGRGVRIAVIDSGVNPWHPHIGSLAGAVAVSPERRIHGDVLDRLGHGTAVAAAIHEKAPAADLHIVKLFHDTLATNLEALVFALDWAVDEGIQLINLSLGTANADHAPALAAAVERVRDAGSILISAGYRDERAWYPGVLPGVLGVRLDGMCPRDHVRFTASCEVAEAAVRVGAAASGFARPIPGVPPERNLNGVSFAVANCCGIVACVLEGRGPGIGLPELAALLELG